MGQSTERRARKKLSLLSLQTGLVRRVQPRQEAPSSIPLPLSLPREVSPLSNAPSYPAVSTHPSLFPHVHQRVSGAAPRTVIWPSQGASGRTVCVCVLCVVVLVWEVLLGR